MPITLTTRVAGQVIRAAHLNDLIAPVLMLTTAVYNVTESTYGATGDGSTDDTTAINAAITAANSAGGGIVYVPEGTYIVTGITMKSNVILRGTGVGSVIKLKASTTSDVIKTGGSGGSPLSYCGVEYLTVDGNKANQSNGVDLQQYGVNLNSTNDSWVSHVRVINTQRSGIYLSGSRNTVEHCLLSGIGKVGAASSIIGRSGIVCDSDGTNDPLGSIIRNNRVIDCLEHGIKVYPGGDGSIIAENVVYAAGDRGVYLQGCDNCAISGNTIDGALETGIFVGDGSDAGEGNSVTGNTVANIDVGSSNGHGILIQNQSGAVATGNIVTSCYSNGIYVLSSPGTLVNGNRVRGNGTNGGGGGITVYQSSRCNITGNTCTNQGTTGSRGAGIWFWDAGSGSTYCLVSGNRCYDSAAGASKKQAHGVLSENSTDYLTLAGNELSENYTGTYSLVGSNNTVLTKSHTQMTIGPWILNDVPGTSTVAMALPYMDTGTTIKQDTANLPKIPAAAHAVGLMLVSDDDRTAGSATVYLKVNGASGTSINATACTLDGTYVDSRSVTCDHDDGVAIAAGNTVQLEVDTSGWTPTNANLTAWLVVSLD